MLIRHLRSAIALLFLASAVAVSAGMGVSQAATAGSSAPQGAVPHGGIGIRLFQGPGSRAGDLRANLYIVDHLAQGSVIRRKFQVTNLGDRQARLLVYPAAATIAHGSIQFAAGHTQDAMTTWVKISRRSVDLAPRSAATLTATIAVPRSAPSGEQYGVIWAEQDSRGSGNILMVSRVGIRIYLSVGSGTSPAPDFTLGTPAVSRTSGGNPVIKVPVRNTGGLALDVHGTVQLTGGPGGVQAGPFGAASVLTLAPGQSSSEGFVLSSRLPDGPWQARFTMVSGLITRTETATVSFPGAPAAHAAFPITPVAAGVGAAILLAAAAVLITRARRMRARTI